MRSARNLLFNSRAALALCGPCFSLIGRNLSQQLPGVKRARYHVEPTVLCKRPISFRSIPRKLDAVSIRITQIKRLAHPVVTRSFKRNASIDQATKAFASALRVGYRIAKWYRPVVPNSGGDPSLLSQVFKPM